MGDLEMKEGRNKLSDFLKKSNEKAGALVFSLFVSMILVSLSGAYFSMVNTGSNLALRSSSGIPAINVAESAAELGLWELLHSSGNFTVAEGWTGTEPKVKTGSLTTFAGSPVGEYVIEVYLASSPIIVEASGYIPTQASAVSKSTVKVQAIPNNYFKNAVTAYSEVNIGKWVSIDSYDSRLGPYGGANRANNGHVVTNSISTALPYAIYLNTQATLKGNAKVGPGGNPGSAINMKPSAQITGTKTAASSPIAPASVSPPVGLPDNGALTVPAWSTVTLSASGQYDSISIGQGGVLIIDTNATIYVVGNINCANFSGISINNGAYVNIVLNGNYLPSLLSWGVLNTSWDPARFTLYATDNVTTLGLGTSLWYGNIYAPNADVTVSLVLYGGIIAKRVNLNNWSSFHYDESLRVRPDAPTAGGYTITNWQGN